MKKYFLFALIAAIMPGFCLGASARYTQLVREKQRKMEQLEKCMGASKGLKIAGVSTLGLTAVGVAGNIYEAKEIKKNAQTLEDNTKKIAKTEEENKKLAEQKAEKEAQEKRKTEALAQAKARCDEKKFYEWKDEKCVLVDPVGECASRQGQYNSQKKFCLCNEKPMTSLEKCTQGTIEIDEAAVNQSIIDNFAPKEYEIDFGEYEGPKNLDVHDASEDENKCYELRGNWENDRCTGLDNSELSQEDACWYENGVWHGDSCYCGRNKQWNPETQCCESFETLSPSVATLDSPQ